MHKLTILLFVAILFIVVDCNIIKRQITFPNNESESESDEKVIEGRHWGINHRRTKRPRPGRPTRPTSTTTTTTGNPNEIPQHIQGSIILRKKNLNLLKYLTLKNASTNVQDRQPQNTIQSVEQMIEHIIT